MIRHKFLNNFLTYSIFAFIQKGISFFIIPLYTFLLSPVEFGLVGRTIALGSIYILIFTFALDEAAARFYFQDRKCLENKQNILNSIISLNLLICLFGSILLFAFQFFFYKTFIHQISPNFIILSILIIISSPIYSIYIKLLRIKEMSKQYAVVMLSYTLIQIFLCLFFIMVVDLGALGYLLSIAITSLIFGIYSFIMIIKDISFNFSFYKINEIFKYSISIIPHTISSWGIAGFTLVALGKMINSAVVGIFNAMNFLTLIFNVLTKAIIDSYQPWVYKKLESDSANINDILKFAHFLGLFFLIFSFLLSLFSSELIKLLINSQFHSGIVIVPFLILSSVFLFLGSLLVFILYYYKDKTFYIAIATIIGSLANVLLCLYLIPKYGILGAAISIMIANFLTSIFKQFFVSKVINRIVIFFDLYFFAILNAVIAYYSIYYNVSILNKSFFLILEFLCIIIIYKKSFKFFYYKLRGSL